MAKINESFDESILEEYKATRPEVIQRLVERVHPNRLYRNKQTGQYMTLYSWSEDGTVTMNVSPEWNGPMAMPGINVFGINPDDLEECDLPAERWTITENRTKHGFSMTCEPVPYPSGE